MNDRDSGNGMRDPGWVRTSLVIESSSEDALVSWAIRFLEERAYSVKAAHAKWETPKEICGRLSIHSETLRRNAEKTNRPHMEIRRGASNRIIEVLSNPDFDAFLVRHKYAPRNKKEAAVEKKRHPSSRIPDRASRR